MNINRTVRSFLSRSGVEKEKRTQRRVLLQLEELESRALLSANGVAPDAGSASTTAELRAQPLLTVAPQSAQAAAAPTIRGYTPQQIQAAYGVNLIPKVNGQALNGAGQTIAIVDAYDDPNIVSDVNTFNTHFNLPKFDAKTGPTLSVISLGKEQNAAWASETALDVEWAHAIAPQANILLVQAKSGQLDDLVAAVKYAAMQPGVVSVSMSWGGSEFAEQTSSAYDGALTTPKNHPGVTFVAAAGDSSASYALGGGPVWPATSPNVLAVGGTSLTLSPSKTSYTGESAWTNSGGGISQYEKAPTYQATSAVATSLINELGFNPNVRTSPDVAFNADPDTGFAVYNSVPVNGQKGWTQVGGTSAGAPQWAAIIALADQQLALKGGTSLNNQQVGATLYNPAASTFYAANPRAAFFHDVTTGSNGYTVGKGYDLATGLGSPVVNNLVPLLAGTTIPANQLVRTTGRNLGGFVGPSGSSPGGGYFGQSAARTIGSGLYVTASAPTISDPSPSASPAVGSILAPVSGMSIPASTGTLTIDGSESLASLSLATLDAPAFLPGDTLGSDGVSSLLAPRDAALFGASGWSGARSAWSLSSQGFEDPLVNQVARGLTGRSSDGDEEADATTDASESAGAASSVTASAAGAAAGSGDA